MERPANSRQETGSVGRHAYGSDAKEQGLVAIPITSVMTQADYEEVGRVPGKDVFFIYTQHRDKASITQIVESYKQRYANSSVIVIYFFDHREAAARGIPMNSSDARHCLYGYYWYKNMGEESWEDWQQQ
jgi:hypothetical protein